MTNQTEVLKACLEQVLNHLDKPRLSADKRRTLALDVLSRLSSAGLSVNWLRTGQADIVGFPPAPNARALAALPELVQALDFIRKNPFCDAKFVACAALAKAGLA